MSQEQQGPGTNDTAAQLADALHRAQQMNEAQQTFLQSYVSKVEERNKRDRFWQNCRAVLFALAMFAGPIVFLTFASTAGPHKKLGDSYAAMVRVNGVIDSSSAASSRNMVNALERAFDDKKAKGVVVLVNSPGGSPVQSSIIRNRLKTLRKEHPNTKVWVVGEDMMTSGAYFIATGGDHICANRSSVVGSIGVIQDGWGFDKLIAKLDIERRVYTAGELKAQMDPFRPMTPASQEKVHTLLTSVHHHFIDVVRDSRGDRLKASDEKLFSGEFWTGEEALKLGLIDSLCDLPTLLAQEYGVTDAKDYTPPPSLLGGLARTMGAELADRLFSVSSAPQLLPN